MLPLTFYVAESISSLVYPTCDCSVHVLEDYAATLYK